MNTKNSIIAAWIIAMSLGGVAQAQDASSTPPPAQATAPCPGMMGMMPMMMGHGQMAGQPGGSGMMGMMPMGQAGSMGQMGPMLQGSPMMGMGQMGPMMPMGQMQPMYPMWGGGFQYPGGYGHGGMDQWNWGGRHWGDWNDGRGGPFGRGFGMIDHVEGHIAFLHAELKVTPEQEKAWEEFASRLRENAKTMQELRMQTQVPDTPMLTLDERLAQHEKLMEARLTGLRALKPALATLWAALSEDQRKVAEDLIGDHLGMMWMGRTAR